MTRNSDNFSRMLPRLIRLKDVPFYLGMDRNRFNAEVRPYLVEIPIGEQGVAFDRLDIDAWVDHHKFRNGRPSQLTGDLTTTARSVIEEVRGINSEYVFTYRGHPITAMNDNGWQSARKRAGLKQVRVHDLKHYADFRIMPSCQKALQLSHVFTPAYGGCRGFKVGIIRLSLRLGNGARKEKTHARKDIKTTRFQRVFKKQPASSSH